jgi:hypothetical protein
MVTWLAEATVGATFGEQSEFSDGAILAVAEISAAGQYECGPVRKIPRTVYGPGGSPLGTTQVFATTPPSSRSVRSNPRGAMTGMPKYSTHTTTWSKVNSDV